MSPCPKSPSGCSRASSGSRAALQRLPRRKRNCSASRTSTRTKSCSATQATCGWRRAPAAPRPDLRRTRVSNSSRAFLPTGSGSHSPASTTATNRCTSSPQPAACRSNSPGIHHAGHCRRAGATTTRSSAGHATANTFSFAPCVKRGRSASRACFRVPVGGGPSEPLPMPVSGACDMSPDAKQVAYSPTSRDFRTWKRYQGGWAQDLYIYDLATNAVEQITNDPRSDRDPMWIGDAIYFTSDRDGHLNLFAHDLKAQERPATDPGAPIRRPLAEQRFARPDRLRSERRAARDGREIEQRQGACDHGAERWRRHAPASRLDRRRRRRLRPLAQGRARALRGARRHLYAADRKGPDAQPDEFVRRAREVGPLVARWQEDRVHLRQERRRRSLAREPRRRRRAGAIDPRRQGDALRARVVTRRRTSGVLPTRTASCSC